PDGSALTFGGELLQNAFQEFVYDGSNMLLSGLPWKSGTWTPTLSLSAGSVTYSLQSGHYFRLGPLVLFEGIVNLASVSGGGGASGSVAGLPYAAAATAPNQNCQAASFNYNAYAGIGNSITAQINASSTTMLLQVIEQNGTVSILGSGIGNNSSFTFS